MVFLDLVIYVDEEGFIQTDLHTKPNSRNPYLLPQSNHPSHISTNIPYSLAFRVKRNCSDPTKYSIRMEELRVRLLERGYKPRCIDNAFRKVDGLDRDQILERVVKVERNKKRVRAMFTYDRRLPQLSSIFNKHWKTMTEEDIRLKSIFKEPPMVCYKRSKNIREQLCTARLPPPRSNLRQQEDGFKRCTRPGCRLCPFTGLQPGEVQRTISIHSTGEELQIRGRLDCQSRNIIYVVTCKKDKKQYVGETGNSAEERFVGHKNTVVQACHQGTEIAVGQHFQLVGHSVADVVFTPVEQIFSRNIFVRKVREKKMINQYDLVRKGLNKNL